MMLHGFQVSLGPNVIISTTLLGGATLLPRPPDLDFHGRSGELRSSGQR